MYQPLKQRLYSSPNRRQTPQPNGSKQLYMPVVNDNLDHIQFTNKKFMRHRKYSSSTSRRQVLEREANKSPSFKPVVQSTSDAFVRVERFIKRRSENHVKAWAGPLNPDSEKVIDVPYSTSNFANTISYPSRPNDDIVQENISLKREVNNLVRKNVHQTVIVRDLVHNKMLKAYDPAFKERKYLENLSLLLAQTKDSYRGMLQAQR